MRDRRRFTDTAAPLGHYGRQASDPNISGTMFPGRVKSPKGVRALKDGCNSRKIGGDVLVGKLRGAKIYTLTLEERRTCPRSCDHWLGCYGNGMQWAHRIKHGHDLHQVLRLEVATLAIQHELLLIRLHVLGDFYSVKYADLWAELLARHRGLYVFGFTAHPPESRIGAYLKLIREVSNGRFWVRHSGQKGTWGSTTIKKITREKEHAGGIVCPEQLDALKGSRGGVHCGSCAACWSTDREIVFMVH